MEELYDAYSFIDSNVSSLLQRERAPSFRSKSYKKFLGGRHHHKIRANPRKGPQRRTEHLNEVCKWCSPDRTSSKEPFESLWKD
ncbi:hypothetical protein QR680_013488 [Steinernema hermaphroditum]|nr:hypothetical protein QR680_013488 [Steinernema hermaphroditum]